MNPPRLTIEKHPPERRRRPVETLQCGCSCCCCCCLHTIGGLLGAAMAPAFSRGARLPLTYYYDEETGTRVPSVARPGISGVRLFWRILLVVMVIVHGGAMLYNLHEPTAGLVIGAFILLMILPGLQLVSAVLALLVLAFSARADRGYQMLQVGKITGGLILGTLGGLLAMGGIAMLFK